MCFPRPQACLCWLCCYSKRTAHLLEQQDLQYDHPCMVAGRLLRSCQPILTLSLQAAQSVRPTWRDHDLAELEEGDRVDAQAHVPALTLQPWATQTEPAGNNSAASEVTRTTAGHMLRTRLPGGPPEAPLRLSLSTACKRLRKACDVAGARGSGGDLHDWHGLALV